MTQIAGQNRHNPRLPYSPLNVGVVGINLNMYMPAFFNVVKKGINPLRIHRLSVTEVVIAYQVSSVLEMCNLIS